MSENSILPFAVVPRKQRDFISHHRPVPARITSALDICGLYGPQVDKACGVEEPTVDMWESGTVEPTGEQIKFLAALTGFPVTYFYRPLTDTEKDTTATICDQTEITAAADSPTL